MKHIETHITVTDDTGVLEATVQAVFSQRGVAKHLGKEYHFILFSEIPAALCPHLINPDTALAGFAAILGNAISRNEPDAITVAELLKADVPVRVKVDVGYRHDQISANLLAAWKYMLSPAKKTSSDAMKTLNDADKNTVRDYLSDGQFMRAVQYVQRIMGCSQEDAILAVDDIGEVIARAKAVETPVIRPISPAEKAQG